ncbi:hypothetical protein SSX86_002341 [Deinandra increscens subsp. villosa]|uniref:RRM domain-containing protein n=1 Tax=Deinandra increscens subsp. villosa TaxID=3103831 RepID=A0AAP0H9I3_9ASTR
MRGAEESGWRKVERKKSGRSEKASELHEIVSYYIYNLPSDCRKEWIWDACKSMGRVVDFYISRRRSRVGDVFGFIKFEDVGDIWSLEKKLCNVKIGNLKISVNLEKFGRDGKRVFKEVPLGPVSGTRVPSTSPPSKSWAQPAFKDRSFASVVGGLSVGGKSKLVDLGDRLFPTWCE